MKSPDVIFLEASAREFPYASIMAPRNPEE
jgi:hypothetical protein